MRISILLYFFLLFYFKAFSQINSTFYYWNYKEKTKKIRAKSIDSLPIPSVSIHKPMVEYRIFNKNKEDILFEISDRGLNSIYGDKKQYYYRIDSLERILDNFYNGHLYSKLYKYVNHESLYFGTVDSLIIVNELFKVKNTLKNSKRTELLMSDTLFEVLKKHHVEQHVFMTVIFYQIDLHYPRTPNNWALYSFYVFDMRLRKLIFYNYRQNVTHTYQTMFNFHSQRGFIKIAKPYKKYLQKM